MKTYLLIGIIALICLLMTPIGADNITGTAQLDVVNDTPTFNRGSGTQTAGRGVAINFTCRITDIDNTSTELTVTFNIRPVSSSLAFDSYSMTYCAEISTNQYGFWYELADEGSNEFYYSVTDGNNTASYPIGEYYTVTWGSGGGGGSNVNSATSDSGISVTTVLVAGGTLAFLGVGTIVIVKYLLPAVGLI